MIHRRQEHRRQEQLEQKVIRQAESPPRRPPFYKALVHESFDRYRLMRSNAWKLEADASSRPSGLFLRVLRIVNLTKSQVGLTIRPTNSKLTDH
jgi:hypothetical protein